MATPTEILALRRMINDASEPYTYSDVDLAERIDTGTSSEAVAAVIWREKAASFSELVDVSESGSSRKLSDLRKGALEQAAYYDSITQQTLMLLAGRPRTRPIIRPTL